MIAHDKNYERSQLKFQCMKLLNYNYLLDLKFSMLIHVIIIKRLIADDNKIITDKICKLIYRPHKIHLKIGFICLLQLPETTSIAQHYWNPLGYLEESWRTEEISCHLDFSERPLVKTGVKNTQIIMIIIGLSGRRTRGDHPNYNIFKNTKNTEKSPGVLRRLAVTQTPVKYHQLKLVWKTLKE